ncbi:uncharacterized protein TRIREDRAFT_104064 [Trichoderma reesei QM6a]|uniref:Predicted protein n=2 Tax=Hypocrea jecorina TaxID=51453 RepID=G0RB73_HYPJQ|nr:uncharacterized protein TRIREDRAFT_104064 [Trichoderma reesei QM6a]EGR51023.1 predicted protein [Trichoderma reesei QM6a]
MSRLHPHSNSRHSLADSCDDNRVWQQFVNSRNSPAFAKALEALDIAKTQNFKSQDEWFQSLRVRLSFYPADPDQHYAIFDKAMGVSSWRFPMPRECLVSRQEVYLSSSLFLSLGMDLFPRLRNQRNPSRRSLRFGDEKKMSWHRGVWLSRDLMMEAAGK